MTTDRSVPFHTVVTNDRKAAGLVEALHHFGGNQSKAATSSTDVLARLIKELQVGEKS
ncbi:hypothetical protein [Candidatus Methylomirabilis sp.]|uniref:Uncharacterized protein n=1 Tax=Candidatus Methylomirabilis tolerans TaxID=3123416 RepID=A0AAJ1EKF4_9BACT|nr:hypothetical protein [Candidatus Methylomirabilis sp.]